MDLGGQEDQPILHVVQHGGPIYVEQIKYSKLYILCLLSCILLVIAFTIYCCNERTSFSIAKDLARMVFGDAISSRQAFEKWMEYIPTAETELWKHNGHSPMVKDSLRFARLMAVFAEHTFGLEFDCAPTKS